MTKVGVLGSGDVGKALALGFKKHGYDVRIGSREGTKLAAWSAEHGIAEGTFADVAAHGAIVVLAVAGHAAADAVGLVRAQIAGKTVLDATNPISGAPVDGILPYFTGPNESLLERLQALAPDAHFVKAFSCVGNGNFVNPALAEGRPTMFIAGNDEAAKGQAVTVLDAFGWDVEDVGKAAGARAIEPLAQLWCARGFLKNSWGHAFKLLRH